MIGSPYSYNLLFLKNREETVMMVAPRSSTA
jgi:hypothetical protein